MSAPPADVALGSHRPRIPSSIRVLLGANLISSLGSGLTMPFLLVYLHDVRSIPLATTGLLIGAAALVGVPAGPLMGAAVDRFGARRTCAATVGVSAAGTLGLVLVRDPLSALPVLAVYGFGQGALWPTWNALFAVMVPDEGLRPRVFARSFQLMNLGLGAGAMVAGAVVHVSDPSSFTIIYAIDGTSTLALVAGLLAVPERQVAGGRMAGGRVAGRRVAGGRVAASAGPSPDAGAREHGGYRAVLTDRRFRRYLVASLFLALCGYSAVEAGLVGYATHVVQAPPYVVSWAFGLNTGIIVVAQPLGLRLVDRMRRTTALMCCAAFFGASWAVLFCGGLAPRSATGNALVVAMFGVFSLGEVLLAPVGAPLVTMLATPELQGRYNATATTVYASLNVVGPSIAGVLLGTGLGNAYLGLLVAASIGAVAGFGWLRRVLEPEIDNPQPVAAEIARSTG
jgi:MFS family permease